MTLRKVPGALTLGLLASLAAHAALYGRGHAMGGDQHALLVEAALAGVLCLLAFFGALAWNGSKGTADGSIVAARLQARLPGAGVLFASTLLWYFVAEAIEPHHSPTSTLAAGVALATAAWLLSRLARAFVTILAGTVIAVRRTRFSPRTVFRQRRHVRPLLRRASLVRRRYARPPPVAVLIRA